MLGTYLAIYCLYTAYLSHGLPIRFFYHLFIFDRHCRQDKTNSRRQASTRRLCVTDALLALHRREGPICSAARSASTELASLTASALIAKPKVFHCCALIFVALSLSFLSFLLFSSLSNRFIPLVFCSLPMYQASAYFFS